MHLQRQSQRYTVGTCSAAIGDKTTSHPKTTESQAKNSGRKPAATQPMLSTAVLTAPPSSLLLHHRRRRRYLDSRLHVHSSHLPPRHPPSQHPQPHSLSPSSPLRFDRAASPPSSPPTTTMGDYRHMRSGSLNIPSQGGAAAAGGGGPAAPAPGPAHGRFDGPRSPPSTSQRRAGERYPPPPMWPDANGRRASIADTSHVPCKFFRQGACQAGSACPFSHDLGAASETVCKYFAKVRDLKHSPMTTAHLPPLFPSALSLAPLRLRLRLSLGLQPRLCGCPYPCPSPCRSPSAAFLALV